MEFAFMDGEKITRNSIYNNSQPPDRDFNLQYPKHERGMILTRPH
jgi:hypothetical protein